MKITVCDISGMGGREHGGYEWGCQVICLRALRFLQSVPVEAELPRHREFQNITGIAIADNPRAEEMDAFISEHPVLREAGMTGAMHQFGIAHARKIHELGREAYLKLCRKTRNDSDFYEFDDSDAFPEDTK